MTRNTEKMPVSQLDNKYCVDEMEKNLIKEQIKVSHNSRIIPRCFLICATCQSMPVIEVMLNDGDIGGRSPIDHRETICRLYI